MTPPHARRVMMTTDAVGGVWVYATDLARSFCSENCEVTLVVMGPPPRQDQLDALYGIEGLRVEITDLALEWMDPEGAGLARTRERLLQIAERVDPDIVHLNCYREASFDWPAPVAVVAHSCVVSWWQACHGHRPQEPRWLNYAEAVASGLAKADRWVAPTSAFRENIEAIYRPPTRGLVIRNGVELPSATTAKQPFILAAGRLWDQAKNLAAVATIAPQVDWPVRVAGPLESPDPSAGHPPVDGIECLGSLSRSALLAEMQHAGIFAAPALYEPFGLSVLEAATSGCALVLADTPSFRELWSGACLFVDPHDRAALLSALRRLCRNDSLRQHLQRQARVRARRYSLAATAAAYRRLYDTMLITRDCERSPLSLAPLEVRA